MDHLTEAEELIYSLALGNPLPDRATGGGRASPFTCAAANSFDHD